MEGHNTSTFYIRRRHMMMIQNVFINVKKLHWQHARSNTSKIAKILKCAHHHITLVWRRCHISIIHQAASLLMDLHKIFVLLGFVWMNCDKFSCNCFEGFDSIGVKFCYFSLTWDVTIKTGLCSLWYRKKYKITNSDLHGMQQRQNFWLATFYRSFSFLQIFPLNV